VLQDIFLLNYILVLNFDHKGPSLV